MRQNVELVSRLRRRLSLRLTKKNGLERYETEQLVRPEEGRFSGHIF